VIWKRTGPELVSRAEVTIANPERYAKQLACHLGRRVEVESTPDATCIASAPSTSCR
jgi:hypothetical protein